MPFSGLYISYYDDVKLFLNYFENSSRTESFRIIKLLGLYVKLVFITLTRFLKVKVKL